jgi:hypothetical protein
MEYFQRNGVVVRDSVPEDVELLANNMREDDINEVLACGDTAYKGVKESYELSVIAVTVEHNGKVLVMSGLSEFPSPNSLLGKTVVIWMLSAKEIENHKTTFGIISKKFLKAFLDYYPVLQNLVDARYTTSIKWLEWLGATIGPEIPFGANGEPFKYFVFKR